MATHRHQYSAAFKFKVALEAVKGQKTISELAGELQVHPPQIRDWKRLLLEEGASVFQRNGSSSRREHEALHAALYEQIGRRKLALEWLKRKVARGA